MIKFHLKNLLEHRNVSINQVSNDTGINRASLTSIANNSISMVRLETLDTLCNYFLISLDELITFVPDDYNIEIPFQSKNSEWIYALAVRKSVIEETREKNIMYNSGVPFIVYMPGKYSIFGVCSVGMPMKPVKEEIENQLNLDFKKTKRWLDSLTKDQALDICKYSVTIFLNKYAKRRDIEILSVIFNADNINQTAMSSFVFSVNKTKNGQLSLELLKSA